MNSKTTIFKKNYCIALLIAFFFGTITSFGQVLTITGNGNVIANDDISPSIADNTDYGTITKDTKLAKSFTIKNTGNADLAFATTVVNRVVISGANADQFIINVGVGYATAPLILKPDTYVIMEVSFKPTSIGLKNATITVGSNDLSDTTYSFNIQGNASTYSTPTFKRTVLAPILNYPTNLYVGPDDYLWISERAGKKISRISKDGSIVDNILDLSSVIYQTVPQDGLMGIVLHPDLGKGLGSDYVYVAYTYNNGLDGMTITTGYSIPADQAQKDFNTANNPNRKLRIVRYNYSVSSNDGTLSSPLTLIEGITGGNDHNSGRLLFGPDNKLYYTVGDHGYNQGGGKCSPINSQNIPSASDLIAIPPIYTNYQGKCLRLNLDGTIPTDNPTINGVKSHVFTYGHRNPSGLTFGKTGILYSSEHGPNFDDELNILQSGQNYGWPNISGFKDDKNYKYLSLYQYAIDNAISPCSGINNQSTLTEQYGALESSWNVTFTNPISTWGSTIDNPFDSSIGTYSWPTIAPSSIKIYDTFAFEIPGWNNSIFTTTLKNGRVYRQKLSNDGLTIVGEAEELFETINRYRDIAFDPNGKVIYLITDTAGATSVVINTNNAQPVTDKGKIIVYTYEETPTSCSVPVPDLPTLTALSDPCCIATITPPTATSNCSSTGGIIGTTATGFPITSSQTITWTYTNGDGSSSTQNQTVTITNPTTTWNGSTWSNGTPDATKTAILTANYPITSNLSACSLIVDNNANVTVNSGFNVTLAGSLIVKPGSSFTLNNNAALYQTSTTAINYGNITVKRNSSQLMLLDYTLWSSPVANQTLLPFSPSTLSPRFYIYNTSTNFYNTTIPSINNFEPGKGYLIRMPNNHPTTPTTWEGNFTGVPNNGDKTVTMTNGGIGLRFNLIGNPYPSPISIPLFVTTNSSKITGTFYFWRKTNNLGTAYCTYLGSTYTTNGNLQAVNPNGIIQTGQGFIVEAKNSSTSVLFNNGHRATNTANQFFKTKETDKMDISTLWLNATDDLGAFSQMAVTYNPQATLDVDPLDGKYINDSPFALSSLLDNEEYVIQSRTAFDATDEVPLVFKTPTAGNYKIAIDHTEGLISGNQEIILKDKLTGTETNLKSSAYTFSASANVDIARFTLKYQKNLGIASNDLKENRLLVIATEGSIQIKSDITNLKEVSVYDISGRLLLKKEGLNTSGITIESAKFGHQVLIVTMTTQDNKEISKKILN